MGILKSREDRIPVTCAVLSEEARESFFAAAHKRGGRERVAKVCGVPAQTAADWASGKVPIPYHSLMLLAQELGLDPPEVTELRREFQELPKDINRAAPAPRAPKPSLESSSTPPKRREAASRPPKARAPRERAPRERTPRKEERPRRNAPVQSAPKPALDAQGLPKLSEKLAYWTGTFLAAGERTQSGARLRADRRIGQNFASAWAKLTAELFGAQPSLAMKEDGRLQEAELPPGPLDPFLDRLGLKNEAAPDGRGPVAPRWVWSNPLWKTAFLRGVADACAHFHRSPALHLLNLPEGLRQGSHKILASLGYSPKEEKGVLLVQGRDEVIRYFKEIGTQNLKLRDQFRAFHGRGGEADASAPAAPGGRARPKRRRRGGRGRGRARAPQVAPQGTAPSASPTRAEPAPVSPEDGFDFPESAQQEGIP